MIDVVTAGRGALPVATATSVTDNSKLFVTGYSQGGFVAMAAHKAMQGAGMAVTASAPMSGPYALEAFGDAIFEGEVNSSGSLNLALITSSYQSAYGNLYSQPTDMFGGFPTVSTGVPAPTPTNTLRQDLNKNDLRNWAPKAPVLLCGGAGDPTAFFLNTQLMQNYWTSTNPPTGAGSFTVLDVDSAVAVGDPYKDIKLGFAAAKALVAASAGGGSAGDLAVLAHYHAGLVPPFCLSAVKSFFDAFQ